MLRDVRFADDHGIVKGSAKELQKLMNKLDDTAKLFIMKNNVENKKAVVVTHRVGD